MIIRCYTTLVRYLSLDISVLTNLLLHVSGKMCQQMQDQCIVLYIFLLSTKSYYAINAHTFDTARYCPFIYLSSIYA